MSSLRNLGTLTDIGDLLAESQALNDTISRLLGCLEGDDLLDPNDLFDALASTAQWEFTHADYLRVASLAAPALRESEMERHALSIYKNAEAVIEAIELHLALMEAPIDAWLAERVHDFSDVVAWLEEAGFGLEPPASQSELIGGFYSALGMRDRLGWLFVAVQKDKLDGRFVQLESERHLRELHRADLRFERMLARLTFQWDCPVPARAAPPEFYWCSGEYAASDQPNAPDEGLADLIDAAIE